MQSTSPAQLGIVVVTYNSRDHVEHLAESLTNALTAVGDIPVVFVDNASEDGTLDAVRQVLPNAIPVSSMSNDGYAAGINRGVRELGRVIDPPFAVLVINPDVRLRPGALQLMLRAVESDDVAVVVPQLEDEKAKLLWSLRRTPAAWRLLGDALFGTRVAGKLGIGGTLTRESDYAHDRDVDWASGAAMLLSPKALASVPTWDESFFLYSEETDYCLRCGEAGLGVRYVAAARAVHIGGDCHVSNSLWSLLVVNRVRLQAKHHGTKAARAFWTVSLVREMSRAAMGKRHSRAAVGALLDYRSGVEPRLLHDRRPATVTS